MLWAGASALLFMTIVMIIAWAYQRHRKHAGWTDVFWMYGMGLAGVGCALYPFATPYTARQILVAALTALWFARLGTYITWRVVTGPEDGRYVALRQVSSSAFQPIMYFFLQVQAWAAALLALSIYHAAHNPAPGLRAADFAAAALMIFAVAGEAVADEQLRRFKRRAGSAGQIYDRGLWAWTRHPNYVFHCLAWCAYPLIAIDLSGSYPQGWLALFAPLFMLLMLTRVTGIPPLERSLMESKGEAYLTYQKRVSAFFPRPPRREPVTASAGGRTDGPRPAPTDGRGE